MGQLFKVTLRTKHIVSMFDAAGRKTGDTETFLETSHGGLPHATALAYRAVCPDAVIEIDTSYTGRDEKGRSRVQTPAQRRRGAETPSSAPKAAKPAPAPASVISGGDYADLVNKLAAKEAA